MSRAAKIYIRVKERINGAFITQEENLKKALRNSRGNVSQMKIKAGTLPPGERRATK